MTSLYGFGSYFKEGSIFNDIDIVIVHNVINQDSYHEALLLKKSISNEIEKAHITILSDSAELHFKFIKKSKAILLHKIDGSYRRSDLEEILHAINGYMTKR